MRIENRARLSRPRGNLQNPEPSFTRSTPSTPKPPSDDAPSPYSAFFSDHLNEMLQTDLDNTPDGEVGAIDFDPVIAGQDGEADNVKIGQPILLDDRAELEVQFRNGEEVTLYYTLVKEHGGWKVEDIANQQGEEPWSLSALLGDAQ